MRFTSIKTPAINENTIRKAANIAIAVGLIFAIIPALFWAYERYYQLSESGQWEATVSVGSSDSIRALRFSEQGKAGVDDETDSATDSKQGPGISPGIWTPDMVDTTTAKAGTSVAYIEIPKIGVKASVIEGKSLAYEGESLAYLARGPVHVSITAKVGDKGTTLISGHRTMFGAPFHNLHLLNLGDKVIIYTKKAVFVYEIKDIKKVLPADTSEIKPAEVQRLVLSTCDPMYSAAKRLLIICELESAEKIVGAGKAVGKT